MKPGHRIRKKEPTTAAFTCFTSSRSREIPESNMKLLDARNHSESVALQAAVSPTCQVLQQVNS